MATDQSSVPEAYDDLLADYQRATYLGDANMVLSWDQEVMMPEGGTPARSKQRGAISAVAHDILVDDDVAENLDDLEDADLPAEEAAVVREIRRQHERKARVPTDLVTEISEATSDAHPVWQEAKAEDDWDTFAPTVERLLDLKREYAEHIDPDADPYEVLFADYEPYIDLDTAERVLENLRERLVPLIDEIRDSNVDLYSVDGTFPEDEQMDLAREALETLGYDFEHGRIDTAPHPFSSGTQFDARVTTRFDESDPLDSLGSTIHEFGHATYTQGLRQDAYGSPLGEHRGLTVHESQSRLWENHVGRTEPFWELFVPQFNDQYGTDLTARQAYEAANQVYEDNLIRVEADELTYHLHIILRFEIERDLLAGDLDVEEVPAVWNDKMEEYLGVRPDADGEGCLQDIHWSHGSFGYFPTYSLGSVLAAQLYDAAASDIGDLDSQVRAGEFDALHQWLTDNVHSHGQRYTTDDLIEEATGESFTADYFLEYAESKFGDLYEL
ncbi:carboxypeptidase M32 [Natronomonas sp. CBA1123]|uniref:carboxypeptidase M32 n=1 Tax=Natronomonas sp. CBA1123 TaxID=2668070 RepID=UPI0012EAB4D2|nr:carboxypeptidase M32 [Natronomonas sp. CBA1123]MUV86827.1 carboxypeptidase M32 [Natronomonas sp. CBA1123]